MIFHHFVGNLSAILAASLFGAAVVATRVVVQEFPPLSLAVLRSGQGGLILFLCLFIGARDLLTIKLRDLSFLVLLGAISLYCFPGDIQYRHQVYRGVKRSSDDGDHAYLECVARPGRQGGNG